MVEALSQDETGTLMLNRYRPVCRLGRGGQADVYLATMPGPADFHRLVVIKVLREGNRRFVGDVSSFLAEAKLAARLNHPNVVQTLEVTTYRDRPAIVMEHLEGQPLDVVHHTVRQRNAAGDLFWVRIIADALAGLAYAHELVDYERKPLNIVHRDISPQNIFVTYHGQVKLLDFGIAHSTAASNETQEGIVKGKVNYMAPEQAAGRPVDFRADLFAMGVVLWELLAGTRLVKGEGAQAAYALLNEPLRRVKEVRPDIDPALCDIVMRALDKDPRRRFQSATAMRQALESYLASKQSAPRSDDLAVVLQNIFEEQREAVRRKIREFMNRGPTAEMTTGSLSAAESLRVPILTAGTAPPPPTGTVIVAAAASTAPFWIVAALSIVGLAAAAFWGGSRFLVPSSASTVKVAAAVPTAIVIESEPSGVNVFDGDEKLGVTPFELPLEGAPKALRLGADGYAEAKLDLPPGDATARVVVLSALTSAKPEEPEKTETKRARSNSGGGAVWAPRPRATAAATAAATPTASATEAAKPKVKVIEDTKPKVKVIRDEKPQVKVIE
jgi:serine/threonine protein kinase